jgi:transmembrane sensor
MTAHPDEAARVRAADALARAALAPVDGPPAAVDVEAALARVRRQLTARSAGPVPADQPALRVVQGDGAHAVNDSQRRAAGRPPARPAARPAWAGRRARWGVAGAGLAAAAVLAVAVLRRPAEGTAPLRYATATGQRATVRLPDGTRVILGPSTTLVASEGYNEEARTLTLQGEAFFEVTHDARRPFVVRAGPALVRDLGTAFVVRAGAATGRTAVTVTEGAVALAVADPAQAPTGGRRLIRPEPADTAGAVLLRAGERGLVDRPASAPPGAAARVRRLTAALAAAPGTAPGVADDLAWTTGRLVFRDAPLTEVADGLRRWYGLTLRVVDPALTDRTLTASFQGESPEEVLRIVTLALGARIDRRGDTVVVRTKP